MALGELPGSQPREAAAIAVGEMPELPSLPVLPERGPWSAGVGRASAFLAELHVDLQPGGWRLVPRPGIDERRRDSALREDLDAFEEALVNAVDTSGAGIKLSAVGPWTLAAAIERSGLGAALADRGAVRDIAASLCEGIALHVEQAARRLDRAVVLQLEEPLLTHVIEGAIPSTSGLNRIAAVDTTLARELLHQVRERAQRSGAEVILRLPGDAPMLSVATGAGFAAIALDSAALVPSHEDELLEFIDRGGVLCITSSSPPLATSDSDPKLVLEAVRTLWRRGGLDPRSGPQHVLPTTNDGLAAQSPAAAIAMMKSVRDAGLWLASEPEEWIR